MIWQRDADLPFGANEVSTGFLEQRLTPEGVELLRSEAISTGLFDRDREISTRRNIACSNEIRVQSGGRLVQVTYTGQCGGAFEETTAATHEVQLLLRLDDRLSDPASWLPASAWEDPTIRPYVPSRFAVCAALPSQEDYRGPPPARKRVFSTLPAPAADVLRGSAGAPAEEWGPGVACFDLTTDMARAFAGSLEAAGIQPDDTDTNSLNYWVKDVFLDFSPYMPDGEADCGCGG